MGFSNSLSNEYMILMILILTSLCVSLITRYSFQQEYGTFRCYYCKTVISHDDYKEYTIFNRKNNNQVLLKQNIMTPLSFAFINEEEKQKDELDWYKYLKKKDDRNKEDDDDDNEHNINKSGMRDRVSKWFSREKKTESPPVKPIELQ